MLRLIACLVGAATLTGCVAAALRQWPKDFDDENVGGVCGLFADGAVLSYPGGEDRGSGEFCARMQDGDLATVTLFWTLTVTDPAGKVLDTGLEGGLDVFRRQPDDNWKIHVSHAFTK
jgi:hypothetical protein